jgi:hypothetical protein
MIEVYVSETLLSIHGSFVLTAAVYMKAGGAAATPLVQAAVMTAAVLALS